MTSPTTPSPSPFQGHPGQLRKQAKELLKAHRAGDRRATERLRNGVPKLARRPLDEVAAARLNLADAQHALAREHGFESWPRLVQALAPATSANGELDELLQAALANELGTGPLPASVHEHAQRSLHLACALADVEAVEASTEPVDRTGGPLDAPPLVYACASRHLRGDRAAAERRVRIATLLLERGADPNASYDDPEHFDGARVLVSAAVKHVSSVELVKALVHGGARPSDHSALWAAVKLTEATSIDDDPLACLRFLLSTRPPGWTLHTALANAVTKNDPEAVRLMIDAGGNPDNGGGWGGSGTMLHRCIYLDSDPAIRALLFEHGDRRRQDREGRTPIEVAYRLGHEAALHELSELGEEAPAPTPEDRALAAALRGDADELRRLEGTRLTFRRGDHLLLNWALTSGRADATERLLAIGLDPNRKADDGRTALVVARAAGEDAAAKVLERAGAVAGSFDAELAPPDASATFEEAAQALVDGERERLVALLDRHPELVRWRSPRPHRATLLHYLGANGLEAERQKTPPNAVELMQLLLARGAEPDALCATYGGGPAQTTLALLASSSWPAEAGLQGELVRTLCRNGANPNGIDEDGVPLATAIGFSCLDAATALVEVGARVDNVLLAAALGRVELVEQDVAPGGRLRDGAKPCRVDWFAPSTDPVLVAGQALVLAARFDRRDVVKLLLARGVDVNVAPSRGETPLHTACYNGHAEVARILLDAGADPQLRESNYDCTCFGWALEGKNFDVIEVLREYARPNLFDAVDIGLVDETRAHLEQNPSQVNAPEGRGGLLLWSAQQGRLEMVELLLGFGADRRVTNREGKTPRELALAGGHDAVARALSADDAPSG